MRHCLVLPVLLVAVGCGGGGSSPPQLLDARVFLDAGIDAPPTCSLMTALGGLTLGSTATPTSGNWFFMPTSGPNMGKQTFLLAAGLPGSTMTMRDVLAIEYVKPATGFKLNQAVTFDPNPAAAYIAASYVLGDYNSAAMTLGNFYYASSGSVTLSAIGEVNGNLITGAVAATNYREVDDNNADVPGGCTSGLTGLQFNLTQMMAFQGTDAELQSANSFSPRDMQAFADRIERFKLAQAQQQ